MKVIAGIVPQAFHGGAFNGVDCRRFLNEVDDIMDAIRKESAERLRKNIEKHPEQVKITRKILEDKLDSYTKLFSTMDAVFSLLRTPAPTDLEKQQAKESIKVFETLWLELGISITVKAHILFDHAMDHLNKQGGIADRVEDFIEKHHQIIKRLDHLTGTISSKCFKQQQMTLLGRLHTKSHPVIQNQVNRILEESRRKFKGERGETAEHKKKRARNEKREETMNSEFFKDIINNKNS
jgi:hypothetical protein